MWVLSGVTSLMHPARPPGPFALELPGRGGSLSGHVSLAEPGLSLCVVLLLSVCPGSDPNLNCSPRCPKSRTLADPGSRGSKQFFMGLTMGPNKSSAA